MESHNEFDVAHQTSTRHMGETHKKTNSLDNHIPWVGGVMRFLEKIKLLPNVILMLETFRYVLSHVKYKIS